MLALDWHLVVIQQQLDTRRGARHGGLSALNKLAKIDWMQAIGILLGKNTNQCGFEI